MKLNINKLINNLYYTILLLVPVGWFLNWKYYFSRFESEGFGWIGWVLSIGLVIFASYLFATSQFMRQKKQKVWILFFIGYMVLALYSINCTAAGQYWDQQIKNQEIKTDKIDKENIEYWIETYKKDITKAEEEIENYQKIRNESIDNLSDMYYYKNTGKTLRQLINEENKKIDIARKKLKELTDKNKVSAKNPDDIEMSKTLYIFYRRCFKQPEGTEETIQFVFQILLSIIIESIAQLSIFSYMKIKYILEHKDDKKLNKTIIPEKINHEELRHFSVNAWRGINTKQSKMITDKKTLINLTKRYCIHFTEKKYIQIIKKAIVHGLLKSDKNGLHPADFVSQDIFYSKMKKILKIP